MAGPPVGGPALILEAGWSVRQKSAVGSAGLRARAGARPASPLGTRRGRLFLPARACSQGDQDAPEYRALQAFGQVPVFKEDGFVLFETGAIVLHIGERCEDEQNHEADRGGVGLPNCGTGARSPGRVVGRPDQQGNWTGHRPQPSDGRVLSGPRYAAARRTDPVTSRVIAASAGFQPPSPGPNVPEGSASPRPDRLAGMSHSSCCPR